MSVFTLTFNFSHMGVDDGSPSLAYSAEDRVVLVDKLDIGEDSDEDLHFDGLPILLWKI